MIKFFRKIRQNLLSEGKTGKYFKYAIGEIILVVIGILIAIQLNNFNEHKQKEKNGIQLLTKLKDEIKQDIIYLDSVSNDYNRWSSQTQYVLDSILNGKVLRLERLEQFNIGRGSMNILHLNKSSYSELLNSGSKLEIKNNDLKNKIVTFFQETDIELNKLNSDNERFNKWVYDNSDVTLWHKLWANRNLNHEDWSWLQNPSSDKFRAHETYALFFQNAIKATLTTIKSVRSNCENLTKLIEKELNK